MLNRPQCWMFLPMFFYLFGHNTCLVWCKGTSRNIWQHSEHFSAWSCCLLHFNTLSLSTDWSNSFSGAPPSRDGGGSSTGAPSARGEMWKGQKVCSSTSCTLLPPTRVKEQTCFLVGNNFLASGTPPLYYTVLVISYHSWKWFYAWRSFLLLCPS